MLDIDPDAGWERGRLRNLWTFRTGSGHTLERLDDQKYQRARAVQRLSPYLVGARRGSQWWWYRDRYYRDDAGLLSADVKAIVTADPHA